MGKCNCCSCGVAEGEIAHEEFWENFYSMALEVRNSAPTGAPKTRTLRWAEKELSKAWAKEVRLDG